MNVPKEEVDRGNLVDERLVFYYFAAALTYLTILMLGGLLMALQLVHWNPLRGIELLSPLPPMTQPRVTMRRHAFRIGGMCVVLTGALSILRGVQAFMSVQDAVCPFLPMTRKYRTRRPRESAHRPLRKNRAAVPSRTAVNFAPGLCALGGVRRLDGRHGSRPLRFSAGQHRSGLAAMGLCSRRLDRGPVHIGGRAVAARYDPSDAPLELGLRRDRQSMVPSSATQRGIDEGNQTLLGVGLLIFVFHVLGALLALASLMIQSPGN